MSRSVAAAPSFARTWVRSTCPRPRAAARTPVLWCCPRKPDRPAAACAARVLRSGFEGRAAGGWRRAARPAAQLPPVPLWQRHPPPRGVLNSEASPRGDPASPGRRGRPSTGCTWYPLFRELWPGRKSAQLGLRGLSSSFHFKTNAEPFLESNSLHPASFLVRQIR